ncbi:maleylpyruvate isomerase family mycothiol-dependent enzyme [Microbispora sp. H10836]|uniref:maleylpyruvate isomerase family mycothiol-dependent enzyme n=1 Tax=Microbispora sp. H10836 TaxID=2729106 RepID=UPI001B8B6397|nr:maleylpyruvate isomerase family mycothiol-dependent enzyme [Microbispora sp. H10836]
MSRTRVWMDEVSTLFLLAMSSLDDDELSAPTALPGWTRRHVLAHVGWNARALQRLVGWARTGVPAAMYASAEQRVADIEEAAGWEGQRLRELVAAGMADLAADLDGLDDDQWQARLVVQGRTVRAAELPWLRTREVGVHAVDLGAGVTFEDLAEDLCAALLDDVAGRRSSLREDPALLLRDEAGRSWTVEGHGVPMTVTGSVHRLASWLTGRGGEGIRAESGPPPALTPWL